MSAHIKNTERAQLDDLMLHLKLLEKQGQVKPKTSRRREITKIQAKINEIETKKKKKQNKINTKRINETKSCFFEKINMIDRPIIQ
jgi:hypothetical protein